MALVMDSPNLPTTYADPLRELDEVCQQQHVPFGQGECLTNDLELPKGPAIYSEMLREHGRVDDELSTQQVPAKEPAIYAETLRDLGKVGSDLDSDAPEKKTANDQEEVVKEPAIYAETLKEFGRVFDEIKPAEPAKNVVAKEPAIYAETLKGVGRLTSTQTEKCRSEEEPSSKRVPLMCWLQGVGSERSDRILVVVCENEKVPCFQEALSWCQSLLGINSAAKDVQLEHTEQEELHEAVRTTLFKASGDWARIAPKINVISASAKDMRAIGLGWNKRQLQRAACFALALTALARKECIEEGPLDPFHRAATAAPCFTLECVLPSAMTDQAHVVVKEELADKAQVVVKEELTDKGDRKTDGDLDMDADILPDPKDRSEAWRCISSSDEEDEDISRTKVIEDADNLASGKRRQRDYGLDDDADVLAVQRQPYGSVVDVARPSISLADVAKRFVARRAMRRRVGDK